MTSSHVLPDVRDGLVRAKRVNMTALAPHPATRDLVPTTLTLKELLEHFIAHRDAVLSRRIDGRAERMNLIRDELTRIAEAYGGERRTRIE